MRGPRILGGRTRGGCCVGRRARPPSGRLRARGARRASLSPGARCRGRRPDGITVTSFYFGPDAGARVLSRRSARGVWITLVPRARGDRSRRLIKRELAPNGTRARDFEVASVASIAPHLAVCSSRTRRRLQEAFCAILSLVRRSASSYRRSIVKAGYDLELTPASSERGMNLRVALRRLDAGHGSRPWL